MSKETEQERLRRERCLLRKLKGPQLGLETRIHKNKHKNPKEIRHKWKQRRYKDFLEDIDV